MKKATGVGKLYSDSAAEVLEYLRWLDENQIRLCRGDMSRQMRCLPGAEARSSAEDYATDKATVTASVLNVRSGQGTENEILTQVEEGEEYVITGEPVDGWYPVKVGETDGWVCGEYITAETSYSYGETKEEEEETDRGGKSPGKKRNRQRRKDRQLLIICVSVLSGTPMYGVGQVLQKARIVPVFVQVSICAFWCQPSPDHL